MSSTKRSFQLDDGNNKQNVDEIFLENIQNFNERIKKFFYYLEITLKFVWMYLGIQNQVSESNFHWFLRIFLEKILKFNYEATKEDLIMSNFVETSWKIFKNSTIGNLKILFMKICLNVLNFDSFLRIFLGKSFKILSEINILGKANIWLIFRNFLETAISWKFNRELKINLTNSTNFLEKFFKT